MAGTPALEEWDELALAADNVFVTGEWITAWQRHIARDRSTEILAKRDDAGRLQAVTSLMFTSQGPLTILRLGGHIVSDQVGIACRPQDLAAAQTWVRARGEASSRRWHVFLVGDVAVEEGWGRLPGAVPIRNEVSPVLRFEEGDWDAFLAARSRNFREQVRRRERSLRKNFEVRVRLSDEARLRGDLDTLFRLHVLRWGADAPFAREEDRLLHADFANATIAKGWIRLWILELDGAPAAAWYGFRFGRAEYYYQAGRDPRFEEHSIGFVLLTHSIRAALEDGMSEYRFLRGAEGYKSRFANGERRVASVAFPKGLLGRVAVAAARRMR